MQVFNPDRNRWLSYEHGRVLQYIVLPDGVRVFNALNQSFFLSAEEQAFLAQLAYAEEDKKESI
jgi:hypothetical protein